MLVRLTRADYARAVPAGSAHIMEPPWRRIDPRTAECRPAVTWRGSVTATGDLQVASLFSQFAYWRQPCQCRQEQAASRSSRRRLNRKARLESKDTNTWEPGHKYQRGIVQSNCACPKPRLVSLARWRCKSNPHARLAYSSGRPVKGSSGTQGRYCGTSCDNASG